MAQLLDLAKARLDGFFVLLLPLGLWWMLWLGISPGSIQDIFNPGSFTEFLHGLRAASPFVAAGVAALFMLVKLPNHGRGRLFFFSPLALVALYGLVGVAASLRSPDTSVALYWTALYLTVPLILWAAMWGPDSLRQIQRIIQFNWLIIGLAFVALFGVGLISLNLDQAILNPSDLLRCQGVESWFQHTSGVLRSTGVGRFAAVTGIIALSLVWNGKIGAIWGLVFLASLVLLVSTGARGSMVSFAVAIPVVYWLMSGKRSKIGAAIFLGILPPILWSTGAAETFVRSCLLTETAPDQIDYLKLRAPKADSDPGSSGLILQPTGQPSNVSSTPNPTAQPSNLTSTPKPTGQPSNLTSIPKPAVQPANRPSTPNPTGPTPMPQDRITPQGQTKPAEANDDSSESGYFSGTGRTQIWAAGWRFIELSPVLGYGFQADRLVLGTHMHNAALHALIQTGFLGAIPFIGAILWAWFLLIKTLRNINRLPPAHKTLLVQVAGMLVFLSVRSLPESTGAFFGIDWLLLGPLLLYLRLVNSGDAATEEGA